MASKSICSIADCGKPTLARGWCANHYGRWKRHGTPAGGRAAPGQAAWWLLENILRASDDCLLWPFACNSAGYGKIQYRGKIRDTHRLVCELTYGPPSKGLEAAHACGNPACVNPKHLSWKTPLANAEDKVTHGTNPVGSVNGASKLTESQVAQMRALASVLRPSELADRFNVSRPTVTNVLSRKTWRHVTICD